MRKISLTVAVLSWSLLLLLLSSCSSDKEEYPVLEEIRSAPVVKLESARQQDHRTIFVDNAGTTASIADMTIERSAQELGEEWLYRFTYNPHEKVIDGHEIIVLFGSTSMEIDGVTCLPEEGVKYDAILEWAEGVYEYYTDP